MSKHDNGRCVVTWVMMKVRQFELRWSAAVCLALIVCACCPSSQAEENSTVTNATVASRQVWDYADHLSLSDEQRQKMREIRERFEDARGQLRRTAATNTPPDVQRAAQLNFNDQFRLANRAVAELLTADQKEEFVRLRKSSRPARVPRNQPLSRGDTNSSAAMVDEDSPPLDSNRDPRPLLKEDEYRDLARQLRATYSQPSSRWPAPSIDEVVKPYFVEIGLLPSVSYPINNPYSDAKAELGTLLFFDPRLSGSGQISCASCHDPDLAFADGRTTSFGHGRKQLKRNAPSILNTAFNPALFWDGRAGALEQQASDVVNNQDEMRASGEVVRERLSRIPRYTNAFAAAFGTPEVTFTRVMQAIATFERTITSRGNNFDSFLRGDTNALSEEAVRGLHLFRTTARCINCHQGPNFTDNRFHNEGLSYYGRKLQDLGRYEITGERVDVGSFKTPSLRNIGRTAPYMHNGLFELDGVLNMYNAGMPTLRRKPEQKDDPRFPTKSALLQPLGLNKHDLADLKAFLEALTETRFRLRPPELPPDVAGKPERPGKEADSVGAADTPLTE